MSSGGLGGYLDNLRKSKNGLLIGLGITALLSLLLMLYTWYICFSYMAIALVMYGVPTYFGLKSKKKLAVFGLVLIVILGVGWGLMMANSDENNKGSTVSADTLLSNGTVTPMHGDTSTLFTYTVELASNAPYKNVTLQYENYWKAGDWRDVAMTTSDNLTYTAQLNVDDSATFIYQFVVWDGTQNVTTGTGYGPIAANSGQITTFWLSNGMILSFLQVGLLFFMLLVLTWWMDKSKARMQSQFEEAKAKKAAADKDEKFVCSECGSDVPMDADKCPQCGEKFDEEKAVEVKKTSEEVNKCPKCGAAIFETDKKCWNCGKVLEKQDLK
jgi:ribosomal protein L40E